MSSLTYFALPDHNSAKADTSRIAADDAHFAAIDAALANAIAEISNKLSAARAARGGTGQLAMDRDLEIHRLTARLRTLRQFGVDLCLGRVVAVNGTALYVGRLGLADATGHRVLVDWRSPAAEPFFAATQANPLGVSSRRRYRWSQGVVTDYWDETFGPASPDSSMALDAHSAFIASLGESRSPRMRDVLSTLQADQDAIIRAGSSGALVVDGGPGTGKTVVALHRAAFLLYDEARLAQQGGVLIVGPHRPYLDYVSDVLPNLGEYGVQTCTLQDMVLDGGSFPVEDNAAVALLKSSASMSDAIEAAVQFYEDPPAVGMLVETDWGDVELTPADWQHAFEAVDPGTAHNDAPDEIKPVLVDLLLDQLPEEFDEDGAELVRTAARAELMASQDLDVALARAWPRVDAVDLVADLWSVPAYLARCAPWLNQQERSLLSRTDAYAWTDADLPLLDAARLRLGDADESTRRLLRDRARALRSQEMAEVIDHLVEADDSEMKVMSMLRRPDMQGALLADDDPSASVVDRLAGPFGHVIVDEAQELTDTQWQMILARCPSQSLTIVGDRAQARRGFAEPWPVRLAKAGVDRVRVESLTINYRTPKEVMDAAGPVIRAALPNANVPTSIRSAGVPVSYGRAEQLSEILDEWENSSTDGTACVIGADEVRSSARIRYLTPQTAKGLEFDLVVLVGPDRLGPGVEGAVDRYVSMTRATRSLVILTG